MSLILPVADWPEVDRTMWQALAQSGAPLDDRGALCHLRATSLRTLELQYGSWLAWLTRHDPLALEEPPNERVTMERLLAWLENLSHVKPMTRLILVDGTLRVLQASAPDDDWQAQRRLRAYLKRAAGRGSQERKRGRILSTEVLLHAGLKLAGPEADAATTELQAAKRRRDGTMVAMLSLMPMRRRAFVNLELNRSIFDLPQEILVSLPEDLTKTGVPWEAPVPAQLLPCLRRYINEVRPWLMARCSMQHDHLWVGDFGNPYMLDYFSARIRTVTGKMLGVRVSPHFFRDSAATTLSRMSPEAALLIRPILAHSSYGTAERHYIQAGSIEAGRDFADLISRKKKERG